MALLTQEVKMTEEEYIEFEWISDTRHEYVNGRLIDTPEKSTLNNSITINIVLALRERLRPLGFDIYIKDVKVKIPNESKYYYPDGFATRESGNGYIRYHPEIIVEVVCDKTRKYDTVDKFINYQKFRSLQYYLLVEPAFPLIALFCRSEYGEWQMESFTDINASIPLPLFNFSIPVKEVYS